MAHPPTPALLHLHPVTQTAGLSTVIASLRGRLRPGDTLFSLDVGYGSVKKMLAEAAAAAGARHVELAVQLEGLRGPEDLVAQVAAALPPSCRLAVFDAVRFSAGWLLGWGGELERPGDASMQLQCMALLGAGTSLWPPACRLTLLPCSPPPLQVTSNTALQLPVRELVQLCHDRCGAGWDGSIASRFHA